MNDTNIFNYVIPVSVIPISVCLQISEKFLILLCLSFFHKTESRYIQKHRTQ